MNAQRRRSNQRMSTANSSQNGVQRATNSTRSEIAHRGGANHVLSQLDALMATNYLHPRSGQHVEAYGETKTGDSELTYTQDSVESENDQDDGADIDQLRSSSSFTPLASMPLADGVRSICKPPQSSSSSSSSSAKSTSAAAASIAAKTPSTTSHTPPDRTVSSSFDQWKQQQSHPHPSPTSASASHAPPPPPPPPPPRTPHINSGPSTGGVYSTKYTPTGGTTAGAATTTTSRITNEEEEQRWGQFLDRVQHHEKEKQKYVSVLFR
jgi:hypothetical protein